LEAKSRAEALVIPALYSIWKGRGLQTRKMVVPEPALAETEIPLAKLPAWRIGKFPEPQGEVP